MSVIGAIALPLLVSGALKIRRAKLREAELAHRLRDAQTNLDAKDRRIAKIRRTLAHAEDALREVRAERDAVRATSQHVSACFDRVVPDLGDHALQGRYVRLLERLAREVLHDSREGNLHDIERGAPRAEFVATVVRRAVGQCAREELLS